MQARRRLLYTDLALRSFHDDRGRPPQTLDELVPEYIREIPIDPYADKPLVYRPNGDSFILYSVGPDCTDNGGTPKANRQNIMAHGIDWDLDSLVPP